MSHLMKKNKGLLYFVALGNVVAVASVLICSALYGVFIPEGVLWMLTILGIFAFAHLSYKVR